ncbi:uncharacterized protein Z520_07569 [Fonsecaea multimorphosa CBS 102226]|uniref:Pre-rRNA-processing protein RIX1 n=1 Tax=Fonsecaea multimorphosa CBS 102226 TaxID=1442371 RepID=A0A0D2K1F6_9EURO|nr:uncharacterized protein Z520_07569 [Fonsecaea multimorphosa CBS 102226]KIX96849.1 hypothetical protein Z520_07569 [Fonsecaea multimorphosa CBS 102226]OAL22528.1 hypothetical protein AYO22_07086 [Fonsecaea multimorphosa]
MQHDIALRAITTRLSITPVEDLPRISGFLATSLAQCPAELLSSDGKGNSSSVVAHKLKTRITSLLQDKSTGSRLTAAVLIKAIVDNGGYKVLPNWEVWARGLLSCLGKPDPFEVKRVYLATVSRIFILSQDHPVLLREVTTPLLPAFITTCLSLIKPVKAHVDSNLNPILQSVLQCWIQLLPQHATIFRPFLARIKLICRSFLEDARTATSIRELAIQLLCSLLSCVPKNAMAQEWSQAFSDLINSAHQAADTLFRAVVEEYESNDKTRPNAGGKHDFSKEPHISSADEVGLGQWIGMHDGSTRLATFLEWLGCLLSTPTSQAITVPLGSMLDLISRILLVTVPGSGASTVDTLKYNKEASREERESLWMNLPRLHVACLRMLQKLCETFGQSFLPAIGTVVNHVMGSFITMLGDEMVRQEVYATFSCLLSNLNINDCGLRETTFSTLLEHCCNDLRRGIPGSDNQSNLNPSKDGILSAQSTLSIAGGSGCSERQPEVFRAAWRLLPEIFVHCPTSMISRQARTEADRLSVLHDHHDAMMASVMRPMLGKDGKMRTASLLPFLARSAADRLDTEALLRPRMPLVQVSEISAQASLDTQVHHDDHQVTDMLDENGEAVTNPEDPAEALGTDAEQQVTNSFENQEGDEAIQALTARKRKLESVQDGDFQARAPTASEDAEMIDSRLSKVPRIEDGSIEESVSEVDVIETPMAQSLVATTSGINERFSSSGAQPAGTVSNMVSSETIGNDNSDSSDFEIPTIDPGLDTDEEDL